MSLRILLLPLAIVYWVVTSIRSWLYDVGALHSRSFSKPVICVGNITVGGTGKTPVIERIASLLIDQGFHVAVVSRGYRRNTKGQVIVSSDDSANSVGDEPRQIKTHFPQADVIVDANRAAAIDTALSRKADVVLMDDGMQHRSVNPSALILVCDYARPLWRDLPLPAGDKRESMYARLRADVVIINKCPPSLSRAEAESIFSRLSLNDGQKIFFTAIAYADFRDANGNSVHDSIISTLGAVAVAGIGRPAPFFDEVHRRTSSAVQTVTYNDHHTYTSQDLKDLESRLDIAGSNSFLVTTEKDATRLPAKVGRHPVLSLPIRLQVLLGDEKRFNLAMTSLAR